MTATTNSKFDRSTSAFDVAEVFSQSIKGKNILVTGVNKAGLGFTTAEAFASQSPHCLILAGRSVVKVQECVDILQSKYSGVSIIRPLLIDLSSQSSIQSAAEEVLSWSDVLHIDLLINNAGIMRHGDSYSGPVPVSVDGIEQMFATNHLGHFLLTNLLMPKIIASNQFSKTNDVGNTTRIINVSSSGCFVCPLRKSDLDWKMASSQLPENERPNFAMLRQAGMQVDEEMSYIPTAAYCQSKTCNVLFSVGLNQRLFSKHSILSLALNPGEIKTELVRNIDPAWLARAIKKRQESGLAHWKSQEQGASTAMVAACDPKLTIPDENGWGQYLNDCQIMKPPAHAIDKDAAEALWQISEDLTGRTFSY